MKFMIFSLGFLSLIADTQYTNLKNFSFKEKSFIKNVIDVRKEKPLSIMKTDDNSIVIIFSTSKILLKPDGFLGQMWIRDNPKTKWLSLGTE